MKATLTELDKLEDRTMKNDIMYYDTFENIYVSEPQETIAPPERYIPTFRGKDGIYIETFSVSGNADGDRLSMAYTEEEYNSPTVYKIRKAMEEEHHCRLSRLIYWTIPSHKFDKYAEMFGINETEDKE